MDYSFHFKIVFKDRQPTRKGILSSVSVICDPLGFLEPVILDGKRILQDICPIPADIIRRWETWKNELVKLKALRIQRCYKPDDFDESSCTTSATLALYATVSATTFGW